MSPHMHASKSRREAEVQPPGQRPANLFLTAARNLPMILDRLHISKAQREV
jgi:hypothetical protein